MSRSISDIDRNLAVETVADLPVEFHSALEAPFALYGLCDPHDGKPYRRIPKKLSPNHYI